MSRFTKGLPSEDTLQEVRGGATCHHSDMGRDETVDRSVCVKELGAGGFDEGAVGCGIERWLWEVEHRVTTASP